MPNSDEKVIRFIDSCYNNLFSLPDGGTLVIVRDDGEVVEKPCHYVDDYHFQSQGHTWHICEFAERMEQNNAKYFPQRDNKRWPSYCYSTVKTTGELIVIHAEESGYYPANNSTTNTAKNRQLADMLNARLGVTKAMEEAMYCGSLFGWHTPVAQPENYTEDGSLKPTGSYSSSLGERARHMYAVGSRVVLDELSDELRKNDLPPGTKGVIQHIDDIGQIEVVWETGLTLRLVPEEDKFHIDNTPEPDMFEEQEAAEEEL